MVLASRVWACIRGGGLDEINQLYQTVYLMVGYEMLYHDNLESQSSRDITYSIGN